MQPMSREEFVARMSADMEKKKIEREKEYKDYLSSRVHNHYAHGGGKRDLCSNFKRKSYSHL